MKRNIPIVLLLSFVLISGQNYKPVSNISYNSRLIKSQEYSKRQQNFIKEIKAEYKGKIGDGLVSNFSDVSLNFENSLVNGEIIFDERIEQLLRKVYSELKNSYDGLPKMYFYVNREQDANAFCMGDYNILINVGLFYNLDTEDQVAAILAHEIAHQMMKHSILHQIEKINTLGSSRSKKNLRILDKRRSNKKSKAFQELKKEMYYLGADSRKKEFEADSLGYEIYRSSGYNEYEYITAFEKMYLEKNKEIDSIYSQTYRTYFSTPSLDFDESWLLIGDYYEDDLEEDLPINKDSLRTHPKMEARIAKLQKSFPELNDLYAKPDQTVEFKKVKEIAEFELPGNLYFQEKYGKALFESLVGLQNGLPEKQYQPWLARSIVRLAEARNQLSLGKYLDPVDVNEQSKSYQRFLGFMWNLSRDDWQKLAEHYATNLEKSELETP